MSTRRRLTKELAARTPFPDLPMPSKFRSIPRPESMVEVSKAPESSPKLSVEKPKLKPEYKPVSQLDVQEPKIGGELEPEPPKRHDAGDHVVEDLDYSDYR